MVDKKTAAQAAGLQTNLLPTFKEQFARLTRPDRRFDVMLLTDVVKGVFNGDPDRMGEQRTNVNTGFGVATDVCAKRILRDTQTYMLQNGYPDPTDPKGYAYDLYMQHKGILNAKHQEIYAACGIQAYQPNEIAVPDKLLEKLLVEGAPMEMPDPAYALVGDGDKYVLRFDGSLDGAARAAAKEAFGEIDNGLKSVVEKLHKGSKIRVQKGDNLLVLNAELCRRYWDVRMFGAVASTGDSCGNVKGPWQVGQGSTFDRIAPADQCITRGSITKIEDATKKDRDMGRKSPMPYALFGFNIFYNPHLAARVGTKGVTEEDMKLFWTCLYNFGRFAGSSQRGHVEVAGIYVFAHEHPLGNAHAHELFDRVAVTKVGSDEFPNAFTDYRVSVDETDMPAGVELIKFYERKPKNTTPPSPQAVGRGN